MYYTRSTWKQTKKKYMTYRKQRIISSLHGNGITESHATREEHKKGGRILREYHYNSGCHVLLPRTCIAEYIQLTLKISLAIKTIGPPHWSSG